jgi:hypothetical protein
MRRAMESKVEIYELESGHVHVRPHGCAEGMIEFESSAVFAEFVARCQQFLDNDRHAKKTMEWLAKDNRRFEGASHEYSTWPSSPDGQ